MESAVAELVENRTFDEIRVGDTASLVKTVTKEDIDLYGAVSGDANPVHFDEKFARAARFDGITAHSMLAAGLFSNLLGNKLPGAGTTYLRQDLNFRRPVLAGDTVTVSVTAREKRSADRVVLFDCACVNQDGETVLAGTAEVIAPQEKSRRHTHELPQVHVRRHEKYERLIAGTKENPAIPTVVAHPCDETSLKGAVE